MPDIILITPEQLRLILPNLSIDRSIILADKMNFCCPAYDINTKDIFEEFLTSIIHESQEFRHKEENLYYRTPEQLKRIWPDHFPTLDFAKQYTRNPQKLGEYIYGSTSIAKKLGNTSPADGWIFKGTGYIQMTGRWIMTAYSDYVGVKPVEDIVHLIKTDEYWSMDSACWVYAVNKKLIQLSIDDDLLNITKKINGGTIGMVSREYYYNLVKKYLYK